MVSAARGPTNINIHFEAADVSCLPPDKFREHLVLAAIVRRQVFVEELEYAEAEYQITAADNFCRHVFIKSKRGIWGDCVSASPWTLFLRFPAVVGLGLTGLPVRAHRSSCGNVNNFQKYSALKREMCGCVWRRACPVHRHPMWRCGQGLVCVGVVAEGDAIMGYVRWRLVVNPATTRPVAGVLDMLAVLARYRQQSLAKRLIGYCIQV